MVKLAAIAVIYYVIYVTFGYVVAWSNPDLQAMYAEGANNQLLMVWGVIPLQLLRPWSVRSRFTDGSPSWRKLGREAGDS